MCFVDFKYADRWNQFPFLTADLLVLGTVLHIFSIFFSFNVIFFIFYHKVGPYSGFYEILLINSLKIHHGTLCLNPLSHLKAMNYYLINILNIL